MLCAMRKPVVLYRFSTSNHNVLTCVLLLPTVVLYRFSTSNHNEYVISVFVIWLYYIVSLHQTTTGCCCLAFAMCCIISFLYIKPQHMIKSTSLEKRCIISFLYIKPQPAIISFAATSSCIISFLYIKPQHAKQALKVIEGCIISFLYIKPQHKPNYAEISRVVLYRFSTSNHNLFFVTHKK